MTRRTAARRPQLSRRNVKATARIGQWWEETSTDTVWRLAQIHRKDGLVELQRRGEGKRFVTFGELAHHFTLTPDEEA